jgi:cyanate permease
MPPGAGASREHQPSTSAASVEERAPSSPRALVTLTIAFCVASFVATAVLFLLLGHLATRGISMTVGSVLLGLAGACQLVGRLLHPALSRAWSPVAIVAIGLACQSLGAIALLFGTVGLPVFLLAFGGGSGLLTVARPAVVEYLFGLRGFGRTSAVIATAALLARAAAPAAVAISVPVLDSTLALASLALLASLAVPGWLLGLGRYQPLAPGPPRPSERRE